MTDTVEPVPPWLRPAPAGGVAGGRPVPVVLDVDTGAMVAALGAQLVAHGATPSALDLPADSSMPVDLVLV